MISVTAKKLRDNLSEYLDRLQKGDEITIIRHSEIIGVLKPAQTQTKGNGAIIASMLDDNRKYFTKNTGLTNESKTTKDLYRESLNKRYS